MGLTNVSRPNLSVRLGSLHMVRHLAMRRKKDHDLVPDEAREVHDAFVLASLTEQGDNTVSMKHYAMENHSTTSES